GRDVRGFGDLGQRRLLIALRHEQTCCLVDDLLPRPLLLAFTETEWRGCRNHCETRWGGGGSPAPPWRYSLRAEQCSDVFRGQRQPPRLLAGRVEDRVRDRRRDE